MSARASSSGSASNATVSPPKRWASSIARSRRRLATNIVRTPCSCSARAVPSAVSPAPMIRTWRLPRSPSASRAASTATDGDARVPDGDGGVGAHALAGRQRGAEELVGQRAGGLGGERGLVGALDLALDLGLADDHRLEPARHAVEMPRGVAVAQRVDPLEQLGRPHARAAGQPAQHGGLGLDGVADHEVELGAVAGREDDRLLDLVLARRARA